MSYIRGDVSEKQSIVYTSACAKSSIIERNNYDTSLNDHSTINFCNSYDDAFGHQLENGGSKSFFRSTIICYKIVDKLYWGPGKIHITKTDKRSRTIFLAEYGSLSFYGEDMNTG